MAICFLALITGLFFGRSCFGTHTTFLMPLDAADHIRTHSQMHPLGTWRQRTGSAKKEVCFMSGTTATVVVNHSSQEVLLLHFGARVFYED